MSTLARSPMRLALALCLALVSVSASAQPVRIAGIRAALVSDYDGSLQTITPDLDLSNVIIGRPPSRATLVIVDLTGEPGSYAGETVTLRVRSVETRRSVSRQTATIGSVSDSGRSAVLFVLHGTGCDALRVTAAIGRGESAETTIPFHCGE